MKPSILSYLPADFINTYHLEIDPPRIVRFILPNGEWAELSFDGAGVLWLHASKPLTLALKHSNDLVIGVKQ